MTCENVLRRTRETLEDALSRNHHGLTISSKGHRLCPYLVCQCWRCSKVTVDNFMAATVGGSKC